MTLADGGKSGEKDQRWDDEDVDVTAIGSVGENLVIELKISPDKCEEKMQFILFRGDVPMPSDRYQIQTRGNIVQLTLNKSQKEDTGHYALVAKKLSTGLSISGDDRSESRHKIRLSIEDPSSVIEEGEPPIFVRRLSDLAVKVGTRTRFLVEIRSSTSPKVTWHKNDEPVQSGSRFSFVHEGNFYCVDVAPVMVDDQGHWTCMAENGGGRSSCTSFLTVIVPKAYKKPEFVEELRALLTETGTVSLECKVVGVPTPVLKWFKDQKEIKAGDVFALTANPDDPTSLGTYTCEAVNCMGSTCSSSRVHVMGKGSREGSLKPADALTPSGPLPVFEKILRDESCRIGDSLVLSCQVQVPPWPKSITWYNKEGRVEPSDKYHIKADGLGGYSIEIKVVEAMDEGEWKCVATSIENVKQFSTCHVAMSIPKNYRVPRFMESLKAVLTEEGLVSFECKVVGFPTPLLRWFKDGQELHPGDVYQLTGTNSLGSYCCIAKNCMGEAKSIAELTVEDIQNQLNDEERMQLMSSNQAPKFIKGLRSCEARINEDFTFTIQVSVSPEPCLSWYRDDVPIIESEKYRLAKQALGTCNLEVKKLEFMDQAEWKCVAANDFGHSVTSCFLKLVIPKHFKKPKFLESLRAILSEEGAVNLECKVIGVPQPLLKWYKDGVELKPGDIHRIISGQDGTCCLGTYTCEATNCMGSVSSSASLLGFEDRVSVRKEEVKEPATPLHELARNLSLSTIHEERTSQLYDTPQTDHSITMDDRGEVSFSFDGKEVSVSLYETPDLTEEEALQIVEMYADQLSEHITEGNIIELPPMRFTKETSTTGNLLMEAVVIDVSPDYFIPDDEGDDLRTEADVEDVSIMDDQMQSLRSLSYVSSPTAETPGDRVPSGSPPSRPPRRKESRESFSSRSERSEKSLPRPYDWSESYHSAKEPSIQAQLSSLQGQDDSVEAFTDALSSSGAGRSRAEDYRDMSASLIQQNLEKVLDEIAANSMDKNNLQMTMATQIGEALVEEIPVKRKKKKKDKSSRTPSLSSKASSEESYSLDIEEKGKRRSSKNDKDRERRGSAGSNKSMKGRRSRSGSESGKFESAVSADYRRRESDATIMVDDFKIEQIEEVNYPQSKIEMANASEDKTIEDRPDSTTMGISTIDCEKTMSKTNKERLLDNVYKLTEPVMSLRNALVDVDVLLPLLQAQGSPADIERSQIEIAERIVVPVENLCEQVSAIETKALKSAGDRSLAQNVRISLLEAIGGPTEELLRGIELIRRHSGQQDPKSNLIVLESLTDPVDEILVGLTRIEHELISHDSAESSFIQLEKPIALERMYRGVSRLGENVASINERKIVFGDEATSCSVIERLQSVYQSLEAFLSTVPLSETSGALENNVDTLVVETLVRPLEELSRNLRVFGATSQQTPNERETVMGNLEKSMMEMRTRLEALTIALETYERESGEEGITDLHADLVKFLCYTMDDAIERLEKMKLKKKRVTQETATIIDGKSSTEEDKFAIESTAESSEMEEPNESDELAQEKASILEKTTSIAKAEKNETKSPLVKTSVEATSEVAVSDVEDASPSIKDDGKTSAMEKPIPEVSGEVSQVKKKDHKLPELDNTLSLPEMLLDPLIDVQANLSDVISDFESQESADETPLPGGSELAACLSELRESVATAAHKATTLKSTSIVNALVDLREPLLDLQLAMASAVSPEEIKLIREATVPLAELKVIVNATVESAQISEASQVQMKSVLRMLEDIEAEVSKVEAPEIVLPIPRSESLETKSLLVRPPEEIDRAAVALTGVHFVLSTALERATCAKSAESSTLQVVKSHKGIAENQAASNLIVSIEELRQGVGNLAVSIGTPLKAEGNSSYNYEIVLDELVKLEEPLLNLQKVLLTEKHGSEDRHVLNDLANPIRSLKEVVKDVTSVIDVDSTPMILELIEDVEKDVTLIAMEALKKALAAKSEVPDDDDRASISSSSKPGDVSAIIIKWLDPVEDWLTSAAEETIDLEESREKTTIAPSVDDFKRELLKIAIQTSYSEPPSDAALIEALTELQEPLARLCAVLNECHEPENLSIVEGLVQPTKHLLGTILDASLAHESGKVLRPVLEAIEELENQIPLTIKRVTYERELQRVVRSMTPEEPETLIAEEILDVGGSGQTSSFEQPNLDRALTETSEKMSIGTSEFDTGIDEKVEIHSQDSMSLRDNIEAVKIVTSVEERAKTSTASSEQGKFRETDKERSEKSEGKNLAATDEEQSKSESTLEHFKTDPKQESSKKKTADDEKLPESKEPASKSSTAEQTEKQREKLEKGEGIDECSSGTKKAEELAKPVESESFPISETVEVITVDNRPFSETITSLDSAQTAEKSASDTSRADQLDLWTLTLLGPLDRLGNAVLSLDRSIDESAHNLLCRPLDYLHKQIEIAESQFNRPAGQSLDNDVETIIEGFLAPVNQLHSALVAAVKVWNTEKPRPVVRELLTSIADSSTELCELLNNLRQKLIVQRAEQSLQEQQEDASLVETINAVIAPLDNVRNLIEEALKCLQFVDSGVELQSDISLDKRHEDGIADVGVIGEGETMQKSQGIKSLQENGKSIEDSELAKASIRKTETLFAVDNEETLIVEELESALGRDEKPAEMSMAKEVIEKSVEEKASTSKPETKALRRGSKVKEDSLDIEETTAKPLEELIEAIVDSSVPRHDSSSPEDYKSMTPDVSEDNIKKSGTLIEQKVMGEEVSDLEKNQVDDMNKGEARVLEGEHLSRVEMIAGPEISQSARQVVTDILTKASQAESAEASTSEKKLEALKLAEASKVDIQEESIGERPAEDLREANATLHTGESLAKAETNKQKSLMLESSKVSQENVPEEEFEEIIGEKSSKEQAQLREGESLVKAQVSDTPEMKMKGMDAKSSELESEVEDESLRDISVAKMEHKKAELREGEALAKAGVSDAPEMKIKAINAKSSELESEVEEESLRDISIAKMEHEKAELREVEDLAKAGVSEAPEMKIKAIDAKSSELESEVDDESLRDISVAKMEHEKAELREFEALAKAGVSDAPEMKIKAIDAKSSELESEVEDGSLRDIFIAKMEHEKAELREVEALTKAGVSDAPEMKIKAIDAKSSELESEVEDESLRDISVAKIKHEKAELREVEALAKAGISDAPEMKIKAIDAKSSELESEVEDESLRDISIAKMEHEKAELREVEALVKAGVSDAPEMKIKAIDAKSSELESEVEDESLRDISIAKMEHEKAELREVEALAKAGVSDAPQMKIKAIDAKSSELESEVEEQSPQDISRGKMAYQRAELGEEENLATAEISNAPKMRLLEKSQTTEVSEENVQELLIGKLEQQEAVLSQAETLLKVGTTDTPEVIMKGSESEVSETSRTVAEESVQKISEEKLQKQKAELLDSQNLAKASISVQKSLQAGQMEASETAGIIEEGLQTMSKDLSQTAKASVAIGELRHTAEIAKIEAIETAKTREAEIIEAAESAIIEIVETPTEKIFKMIKEGTQKDKPEEIVEKIVLKPVEEIVAMEDQNIIQIVETPSEKVITMKIAVEGRDGIVEEIIEEIVVKKTIEGWAKSVVEEEQRALFASKDKIQEFATANISPEEQADRKVEIKQREETDIEEERMRKDKSERLQTRPEEAEKIKIKEDEKLKKEESDKLEKEKSECAKREEEEEYLKREQAKNLEEEKMERAKEEEDKRLRKEKADSSEKEESKRKKIETEKLKREEHERAEKKEEDRLKKKETEQLEKEELERKKRETEKLKQEELERTKKEKEDQLKKEEAKRLEKEELERKQRETEKLKQEEVERAKKEDRIKKEEAERLEKEELERKKQEAEKLKHEELERAKNEEEDRIKKEKAERLENEELECKKREAEKVKQAELERAKKEEEDRIKKKEAERLEKEALERKKQEAEKLKQEELERAKKEEEDRIKDEEIERLEKEELERKQQEAEKLKQEELERAKKEEDRIKKEEAERLEKEELERKTREAEKLKQEELERAKKEEQDRIKNEEAQRLEKEELERKKQEAEKLKQEELERVKKQEEDRIKKEETQRLEEEELERKKGEAEKLKQEELERVQKQEEDRIKKEEAQRLEEEELERKKQEAEKLKQEELKRAKKQEEDRIQKEEAQRLEKEELERKKREAEKLKQEELERAKEEEDRIKKEEAERLEKEELECKKQEAEKLKQEELKHAKKQEEDRIKKEEAQRLEKEELERKKQEAEKLKQEELERAKKQEDRIRKEETERLEKEELERKKQEAEKLKQEELERAKREEEDRIKKEKAERLEKEELERKKREAEKLKQEELERAKKEEGDRLKKKEAERLEKEELERKKQEAEKLKQEELERAKKEEEDRIKKEEAQRLEKEELERKKREAEKLKREELERAKKEEGDRLKKEEAERLEKEELERKKQEAEKLKQEELERVKKEEENRLKKEEAERLAKDELERQNRETEKLKQEELELAKKEGEERLKKEESARLEKEELERLKKAEAAKLENKKLEKEKMEAERLKKEEEVKVEKEKLEKEMEEAQRLKKDEDDKLKKDEEAKEKIQNLEKQESKGKETKPLKKKDSKDESRRSSKAEETKEESGRLKRKDSKVESRRSSKKEDSNEESEGLKRKDFKVDSRRSSKTEDSKKESKELKRKDSKVDSRRSSKAEDSKEESKELKKKDSNVDSRRSSKTEDTKEESKEIKKKDSLESRRSSKKEDSIEESEGLKKKDSKVGSRRSSKKEDFKEESEGIKKKTSKLESRRSSKKEDSKEESDGLKRKDSNGESPRSSKKEDSKEESDGFKRKDSNGESPRSSKKQESEELNGKDSELECRKSLKKDESKNESEELKGKDSKKESKTLKKKDSQVESRRSSKKEDSKDESKQLKKTDSTEESSRLKRESKKKEKCESLNKEDLKNDQKQPSKNLEDKILLKEEDKSKIEKQDVEEDDEKTPKILEQETREKSNQRHVRLQEETSSDREPRSSSTIRTDSEMDSEYSETSKSLRDQAVPEKSRRKRSSHEIGMECDYEPSKERRETDRSFLKTRNETFSSDDRHYTPHYSATSRIHEFTPGPRDRGKKPSFCTKLTDRTAAESSRIKLTCTVLGDPEPFVYWTKDGKELPSSSNRHCTIEDNGMVSLELYAAAPKDSGEYSCVAKNVHGQAYTEAKLKVYAGYEPLPALPTFTRSIKDTYHYADNELVLECRVRGQPSPKITWLKDGQILQIEDRYQQCDLGDGICRLKISHPDFYDSGLYTCRAENDTKISDCTSHVVNFDGKGTDHSASWRGSYRNLTSSDRDTGRPKFSSFLTDHSVPAGGTIALQVEVKGVPPPDITWLRGDKREPISAYKARTFADSGIYTLIVPEATESETGTYVCRASNAYGYVDTAANVEVISSSSSEGGKPAMFVSRPAETMIHVTVGEDVSVSFRVCGVPKPRIVWMKGLRDITNGPRSYKESSDDYVRLTLKRAAVSDEGTYCIMAKNRYGCDRTFYTVKVKQRARSLTPSQDWATADTDNLLANIHDTERSYLKQVPGPITSEPVVVDGGRNWLALTWGKAVQHGPAPVVAYRVDAWLLGGEGGARWAELGITPVNAFDAFNLRPGGEYKFRITPRNRYGWGDAVTMTNSVTVREVVKFPEFTKIYPGQLKALRGETLNLECEVRSESKAEVKWYRDTTDIDSIRDSRYMTYYNGSKCTMTVQSIKENDSGRYVCEATNPAGRVSTFARVQVVTDPKIVEADEKLRRMRTLEPNNEERPPEFTMRLRDRRVQMTYPVRLTCQVSGHPEPEVTWYKNREEIFQDENVSFWDDESHFHTLEISHSSVEDSGIYMAKARNFNGSVSCRCHLVVDKGIRAYVAPEFFRHLDAVYTVKAGGELRMSAQIEAYPTVGVVWHRDGHRLRPSRSAVMTLNHDGSVELSLGNVTTRDAGLYCCTATNEVGQAESTARVSVIGSTDEEPSSISQSLPDVVESLDVPYSKEPLFVTKPLSTEAIEGDTVIILCEVVGDPKPEVIWLRDFLRPDYYRDAPHFRRVGAGPQYRLEIPYAKLDFTGAYSVIAKNCHGEAKAIISLQIYARGQGKSDSSMDHATIKHGNVQTLPSIKRPLRDLRCCDGDAVTLICKVHATPEPDVRWEKSGKLLPLGDDFVADFDGETARLSIQHVYPEDEGEYTCVAYNDLGKAFTSACLIVDVPEGKESAISRRLIRPIGLLSAESTPISTPRSTPIRSLSPSCAGNRRELKPATRPPRGQSAGRRPRLPIGPKFYAVPHNRVAEEGETVRFQCAIAGHPTPWVTWDKDGVPVTPTARITLKEKDDVRILEITEINHEDAGLYRIMLENDVGRTEATARLEIIKGRHSSVSRTVRTRSASPRTYSIYSRSPITSAIRGDTHLRPNPRDTIRGGTLSPTLPRWHQRNGKPPIESPEPARRMNKHLARTIVNNGTSAKKMQNPKIPIPAKPRSSSAPRQNPSSRGISPTNGNTRQTKTSPGQRITIDENNRTMKNTRTTTITTTNGSMIPKILPISRSRSPKGVEMITTENPRDSKNFVNHEQQEKLEISEVSKEKVVEVKNEKTIVPPTLKIDNDESPQIKQIPIPLEFSPVTRNEIQMETSGFIVNDTRECRPPTILAAPADVIALRGAKVILLATFDGEPQPRVRWLRKGRDVRFDDKAEIETSRGLTCLTLEGVNTEQTGKYAVTLENIAGRDCRYVNVTVEGVPDPPAGTPCVQSITRSGKAIVTWRSPPYDGGCVVTGYSVEMKRADEPSWIAVAEARHSLSHTVTGLQPEDTYQFRVRAENAHGVSEPSATSDIVTVPGENDEEIGGQVFTAEINQIEIEEEEEEFEPPFEARIVTPEEGHHFQERFQVLEELGKGRYGIVRRILEKSTGLNLAAKFIRTIKAKDREQVHDEIGIMNRLRHPKLLRLAAAFESPKEIVMVTEYISGGELFERVVADDFTLTEKDSIQFVKQICEGVEYMHAQSVVHLDLKPENIMCHTRTSHRIKLIDFGLAQTLKPDTPIRVLFGTPEFIPPEIIGFEPIGTESDMWSVGVICYVLLTGLSPFMGDNDVETFANITRADYDFDDVSFTAISQEAKDFISSLLIKRKELRMSAKKCLDHPWLAQQAESMSRVALPTEKLKKFIVRRKWQKTGNAIRALGRMAILSANTRRSLSTDSSPTKSEFGDELFADVAGNIHGFKPIQPIVLVEDRTSVGDRENLSEKIDEESTIVDENNKETLNEISTEPEVEKIPEVEGKNGSYTDSITFTELEDIRDYDNNEIEETAPLIQEIDDFIKNDKIINDYSARELCIEELSSETCTDNVITTDLDSSVTTNSSFTEMSRKQSFSSFANLEIKEECETEDFDEETKDENILCERTYEEEDEVEMANNEERDEVFAELKDNEEKEKIGDFKNNVDDVTEEENSTSSTPVVTKAWSKTNNSMLVDEEDEIARLTGRSHPRHTVRTGSVSRTAKMFERDDETRSSSLREHQNPLNRTTPMVPEARPQNERIRKAFAFWNQ